MTHLAKEKATNGSLRTQEENREDRMSKILLQRKENTEQSFKKKPSGLDPGSTRERRASRKGIRQRKGRHH